MKYIFLVNMGAPNSLSEMRVFLKAMFMDKSILYAPKLVRQIFSTIISRFRFRSSWEKYELIGGSPLQKSMQNMASDLQKTLGKAYVVESVYAYSAPFIDEQLTALGRVPDADITLISMYPQASYSTTGSVQMSIDKAKLLFPNLQLTFVEDYFSHPLFVDYWAQLLREAAADAHFDSPHVVFSAHAIPQSFVDRGDQYAEKLEQSAALIAKKTGFKCSLCYQSKIGPIRWTKPYTKDFLKTLSVDENILMAPLAFLNENLETAYDLDFDIVPFAKEKLGFKNIVRVVLPSSSAIIVDMMHQFIHKKYKQ